MCSVYVFTPSSWVSPEGIYKELWRLDWIPGVDTFKEMRIYASYSHVARYDGKYVSPAASAEVITDLTQIQSLAPTMSEELILEHFAAEVDYIFNLACPASPVHYQHDPVQTTKTSVHGAINVLGLGCW